MEMFEPLTLAVPLREEPAGVLRVGKSRVLLELVLRKRLDIEVRLPEEATDRRTGLGAGQGA